MKKLTKQTRLIIYYALFISSLLIFTVIFYLVSSRENVGNARIWVAATVILIAVLSVGIVILARKKIKKTAGLLNKEYFEVYEMIADSFEGSVLGVMERKETLNDILGLFIDAMNSGKTVEQVTGGDINEFIRRVKSSFGYRNGVLFGFLSGCQYAILYLFLIQGYEWMRDSWNEGFFSASPGYSSIVLLMPIAFFGLPLMRYFIMKQKIFIAMIIPLAIFGLDVAFMEITYARFMHLDFIYAIHEKGLSYVPNWGFMVLWIAVLFMTYMTKWLLRRASIKKL
ncbi:MAG: hypothetical protein JXN10_01375 [Clostridia bacterium]|nr:hypothetical protein [Clostridia bacterium]MBN2882152.1 hypothetical protein [Clostridia bacterium]